MTYEQVLLIKKEKVEKILAEKIQDRNWYAKRVGKELICSYDPYKANMEDIDLEIEALQDLVDSMDRELRNEVMAFEPMSPKDLITD